MQGLSMLVNGFTTEKQRPVVTHVMPIVRRWIPGLSR